MHPSCLMEAKVTILSATKWRNAPEPLLNIRQSQPDPTVESQLFHRQIWQVSFQCELSVINRLIWPERGCPAGTPAAHLAIEVKSPSVTHTVVTRAVNDWLDGSARSPKEAIEKRRLKDLLDA